MRRIRFYFNKQLDKQMVNEFLSVSAGGVHFSRTILRAHPQLGLMEFEVNQTRSAISSYFNLYYKAHAGAMSRKLTSMRHAWRKIEPAFISTTEQYFGGFEFPSGKYIAYLSIIDCNPRFLGTKTFQVYYAKSIPDCTYTIAHELLHFIFFDFVRTMFPKEIRLLSEASLWTLSEIFNVVVLGSALYRNIVNQRHIIPYPTHKRYLSRFEEAFTESHSARDFIQLGIAILRREGPQFTPQVLVDSRDPE